MANIQFVNDPNEVAQHIHKIFFTNAKVFPLRLTLGVSKRCNLYCKACWRVNVKNDTWNELDDESLLNLVEEAGLLGVKAFCIQGEGEPFIRKDICLKLMRRAKELGMRGSVTTNGTLLTEELIDGIVRCGWNEITISLDASYAELHDYLRGKEGTFQKVIKSIDRLQKLKSKRGTNVPYIRINFLVTSLNYKDIPHALRLAETLSIGMITFLPMILFSDTARYMLLDKAQQEDLDRIIKDIEQHYSYHTIMHNLSSFRLSEKLPDNSTIQSTERKISCFLPWYNISISSEGFVDCCDMNMDREIRFPDFCLEEIWRSSYYDNMRSNFLKGNLFDKCKHCCLKGDIDNIRKALDTVYGHKNL